MTDDGAHHVGLQLAKVVPLCKGDREKLSFTLSSLDDPDPFAECTSIPTGVEDALRQVPACTYAPVSCLLYAGGLLRGVRIK